MLRDDHSNIFLANRIEITDDEKVHVICKVHVIPKGYGKYLMTKVLKVTPWQKYDEDIHCPGSCIMLKDETIHYLLKLLISILMIVKV